MRLISQLCRNFLGRAKSGFLPSLFDLAAGGDTEPDLKKLIIYNHAGVIAINKPSGMISQGAYGDAFSIAKGLHQLPSKKWPDKHRLAHRLDRNTSGVVLIARTKPVIRALNEQFQQRSIRKEYWAIVDGVLGQESGFIDSPVPCPVKRDGKAKKVKKDARTDFRVLGTSDFGVSFVHFKPHTGRYHQLRVHAARDLQTPMLGDQDYHPFYFYGAKKKNGNSVREFSATSISPQIHADMGGQLLHARSITFHHPVLDEEVKIEAPLPPERAQIWAELGF